MNGGSVFRIGEMAGAQRGEHRCVHRERGGRVRHAHEGTRRAARNRAGGGTARTS